MKFYECLTVRLFAALLLNGSVLAAPAQAATVAGGTLTLNIDRDAVIAGTIKDTFPDTPTDTFPICCRPSLYLEEFYDANAASGRTFLQIRDDNTPDLFDLVSDEIPAIGLDFAVNGATVANPAGRANQPTTFAFDPNNLFGTASGGIGLGGVTRFRVDVAPPNNRVILGDMMLEYHPELEAATPGRSGWLIVNHIGFTADAFELYDVSTQLNGDSLFVAGSLGFGWGFDHLGATNARLNQARIGTFSFQASVVPVPAAVWLFASGIAGVFGIGRRQRKKVS